ncbi:MAG TPA: L,D-transpeptidase family protein [Ilumatobacteraceae bacterium]|nr:L,D-transpeptidase family protein [Ilumatobacteraceae bacterium]
MNSSARRSPNSSRHMPRWVPGSAAAAILGAVVIAGVMGGGDGPGVPPPSGPTATGVAGDAAAPVSQPPAVVTVETDAPIVKEPLENGTIGPGYQGDDVTRVQQRLTDLGFAPGPIDGQFGSLTKMAVWAFEKLVMETDREKAKGLVTPEIWDRMQDPILVSPRREVSETPRHTEIYLPQQVLAVFDGNKAVFVSHISTGDNSEWCEEVTISPGEIGNEEGTEPLKRGECGKSITPGGVYQYKRRVIGRRESALGGMLNPVYFNYGIAVHGATNVPLQPASHGCIRIPNDLSEGFAGLVEIGDLVYVWDGVKEPEIYGQVTPPFNTLDPDYSTTTTTTTTTSTTTTTTAPPPTTVPSATTTIAPATTTIAATTTAPVTTTTLPLPPP